MRISDWSSDVALPIYADAESGEPISSPARVKLMNQRLHQPRTRHAERMAKRDGSTVGIDLRRIIRDAKAAQYGKGLRSEGLVQLDDVKLVDAQAQPGQQFLRCRHRTDAHHARRHRSEEHTSELQSLMRTSYAVFCSN